MKLALKLALITACLATIGCDGPAKTVGEAEPLGKLPDGRAIACVKRDMGTGNGFHYIYYVENPGGEGHTVTTNYRAGKVSITSVMIDGVKYAPVLETPEK